MRRKYFIHKFIRYFFIFTLPVIIMAAVLSAYSYVRIKKDTDLKVERTFQIGTELMDEIMTKGDDIAVLFNNSPTVSMSLYKILNQTSLNYKEYVARSLISSILESAITNFNYIESIYIYLANDEGMYYQTDKNLQSIADSIDSGWLESFYNQSPELNSWIEKRAFRNYAFEPEHDAVSIFRRIKYFDGVLVTNLNIDKLSGKLSSIENYPSEAILVTDAGGHIMFANENAWDLQFNPSVSITDQITYQKVLSSPEGHNYMSTVLYRGQTYVLTYFDSVNYDLRFLSFVPHRDIYQLLYQIIYSAVIGVLIGTAFCLAFSFYLTNKNFNQIEHLMDILWKAELGTCPPDGADDRKGQHLDEYTLIMNQVIHTFIRNNTLQKQIREAELNKVRSELNALQLQINPHFFFNTLQSIDMEIIKKEGYQAPASRLIHDLSNILRYALDDSSSPVPLREEIRSCKEYFEIQKFHYPGQITLLWDYEESVLDCQIIRLLFQPLIENSIRYSIYGENDRCLIRIKIIDRGDVLRIHVLDTGAGMERETLLKLRASLAQESGESAHIGLKNTQRRLVLSYPGNPGLTVISFPSQGTCISFTIPK
ncbi:sensor histidine kinase [Lachnotalea sp. AF33-28]|uniref:sensor histidine kinase n=1 Tax=Lachnotalea sp. AF33-28 TaxID=2292046 RepID=UPI001314D0AB|nr:histidine kinase [Lachnotalea sp. AF33-28]